MTKIEELLHLLLYERTRFWKELEIFEKENPNEICAATLLIYKNEHNPDKKQYVLSVINSIKTENHSPILVFLFYFHWFQSDTLTASAQEAQILIGKMENCVTDSFPGSLKFLLMSCKADLYLDEKTNQEFVASFSYLPEDSQLYELAIKSLVHEYSRNGILHQIEPRYLQRLNQEFVNLFFFFNYIENGQTKEALKLKDKVLEAKLNIPETVRISLLNSIKLLNLYLGIYDEKHLDDQNLPVKALLDKNPIAALSHAKTFYDKHQSLDKLLTNFTRYTLIRAQLANKNLDAAKLIAKTWLPQNRRYYFSDFFMARIEMLSNNPEKAVKYFAKVLDYCKKNNAMGRLDFELDLAIELQPRQIRFLIDNANALLLTGGVEEDITQQKTPAVQDNGVNRIKGNSLALKTIREDIKKFAVLDIPILILGETGVGKDIIANAIHEESNRKSEPFIAINCSSIADSLLQSELFGHEAGAYTGATKAHKGIFQEAGNGTVFLDEIGDVSSNLQAALLRVLESGEYRPVGSAKARQAHCRIIAATNAMLESRVDAGTFRLDLLYRLKRLVIQVPPLRERPVDITYLAEYFLNLNKDPTNNSVLSSELEKAFLNYSWPGNVRELKNEMEKIRLLHSGKSFYTLDDAIFLNAKSKTNIISEEPPNLEPKINTEKKTTASREEIFQNSGSYFRRLEILKKLFQEHKNLSRKELCQITGVPDLTIGRDLKVLQNENYITKIEPTKSPRTHYFSLRM